MTGVFIPDNYLGVKIESKTDFFLIYTYSCKGSYATENVDDPDKWSVTQEVPRGMRAEIGVPNRDVTRLSSTTHSGSL